MKYFAIRDRKAESSNRIFPSITRATAIRETADTVRESAPLRRNAGDFVLRYIGELDELTDKWDLTNAPADVIELLELVEVDES